MTNRRPLIVILGLALILRLSYGLSQDHTSPYAQSGGDSWVYLDIGYNLLTGFDYSKVSIPVAPVYPLFCGLPQIIFGRENAVIWLRVGQAILAAVSCYFAYRLAQAITKQERAGLVAATVLAISPVFVIESAQILTETLYVFLLSWALCLYTNKFSQVRVKDLSITTMVVVGVLLGLATLTRAVVLLFPLGLVVHLMLVAGWRGGLKHALVLMTVYALVVSTWTFVNRVYWNRWVIGAQGFSAFLFIGASEQGWQGPEQTDANLAQAAGVVGALPGDPAEQQKLYESAAASIISSDPLGWVSHRSRELANAVLQPHGTIFYTGESLKDLTAAWWRDDRSVTGLVNLTQGDAFWPKLAIYIFHYVGLVTGLCGIWMTRRNWRITLPLVGLIVYTLLVHFVLDAIPRYLFPLDLFLWVFGAAALSRWLAAISFPLAARDQRRITADGN